MNNETKQAISQFFESIEKLKQFGVFRSDKYLGDLGEYISQYFYNIELAKSGRQPGHDGIDSEGLVQVKYHGSITRTNIDLGNPDEYQNLLIVLGPNSLLRNSSVEGDFLVYRMSADTVRQFKNENKETYSCGKEPFAGQPSNVLNLKA
ncbi:MAG: hypothetical protein CTY16_14850 [Methylobacter sp.]|nr:MAG: hypothetical protein CTY16_14850 [Methylobacter sp.]